MDSSHRFDTNQRKLSPPVPFDQPQGRPDPRARKKYYFADTAQRRVLILLVRALFLPLMEYDVIGLENFPRRAHVHIRILPPILPELDESPLALTDRLMFTLAKALPKEMRGVYTETPQGFST